MRTYPLPSMNLEEAIEKQACVVDAITREFTGRAFLQAGDYGLETEHHRPAMTARVERVIAQAFHAEDAMLVRGAGTQAIRLGLSALLAPGEAVLVHDAPIYPTTETTLRQSNFLPRKVDFHDLQAVEEVLHTTDNLRAILIQHTRQRPADHYDLASLIAALRERTSLPILVDDNYAAMKVPRIGVELGAQLSCFSCFKLLGPEGVGVCVGEAKYIERIREANYSGGSQVQGPEAREALRGLVYAPVSLAISARVARTCCDRLARGEIPGVKAAFLANAQSKVLLVELDRPIAQRVLEEAERLGAAPYPVGAESKYEIAPMFYRVSGTFLKENPAYAETMIRINPMRAGAETVLRILAQAMEKAVHRVS